MCSFQWRDWKINWYFLLLGLSKVLRAHFSFSPSQCPMAGAPLWWMEMITKMPQSAFVNGPGHWFWSFGDRNWKFKIKEDIPRQGRSPKPKTLLAKKGTSAFALGYGLKERECGSCSWLQSVLSASKPDMIPPLGQQGQQEPLCEPQDYLILTYFGGVPPSHLQLGWETESKLFKVFWGKERPLWPLNSLKKGKGKV